jgi:hypothetical protein
VTDEENKPTRPNANYNLSRPDKGGVIEEDKLVFHYNRERRLEKAPQIVRDLYADNKSSGRFGIFRSLVSSKPKAMLFYSIVILCAIIMVFSFLGIFDRSNFLDGNTIKITGTIYEGATIVILTKTITKSSDTAYYGAVDIAISPVVNNDNEDFLVFYHRIFFSLEEIEEYRFVVPFDAPELLAVLHTENRSLRTSFKPR